MKAIILFTIIFSSTMISPTLANLPEGKVLVKEYNSPMKTGFIGVSEVRKIDNPTDNIFHVYIDQALCGDERIWLSYDLEGVKDHYSVARSINDQVSIGGYLVQEGKSRTRQMERISADWLKEGDNIVRFSVPLHANHGYQISNLKIEVENFSQETNVKKKEIVFQGGHLRPVSGQKIHIKGLVLGEDLETVYVNQQPSRHQMGEFEILVDEKEVIDGRIEISALYADGESICEEVKIEGVHGIDFQYPYEAAGFGRGAFIVPGQSQAVFLEAGGVELGAQSLKQSLYLQLQTLRAIDIPAFDQGLYHVNPKNEGVRFLPHGTQFADEVIIKMPYDPAMIPNGYTPQDIRTFYFDEVAHHWVALPLDSVVEDRNEIWSRTTHFTDMINGVIEVPESPDAQAYTSTTMKDIQAANPAAGINLMSIPQANQMGNANMSFPIQVPAGRGGMQPQLAISYNSGGGNGWLGLGWNLQVPVISVETRWGVPYYNEENESESYLLNGEQLWPMAHRYLEDVPREADKEFFARVEGSFQKIIRKGNSPDNYVWEITDKGGVKYYYGGISQVDPNSVLRTNENLAEGQGAKNIAFWYLKEVVDLNGNSMIYHYEKVQDSGFQLQNSDFDPGFQTYLKKITYTHHSSSLAKYEVEFIRDRDLGEGKRQDISIVGNYGFKMVTADLLRKIIVKFDNKPVRSYQLNYQIGAFFKTLLSTIAEFDSNDDLFHKHELSYYNEIGDLSNLSLFEEEENWDVSGAKDVDGGFINPIANFDPTQRFTDHASNLGGHKTTNIGGGMVVIVGFDPKIYAKTTSVGGSFNYNRSQSSSVLSLLDVDGDGLPDKLFVSDGEIFFRKNLSKSGDGRVFSNPRRIPGIGEFHKEITHSFDFGVQAIDPSGKVFAGVNTSTSVSLTNTYLTDVNGDGLIDIVYNGNVYFLAISEETGMPYFTRESTRTPNPIQSGAEILVDLDEIEELDADPEKRIDENPLSDMVRLWKAPYAGTVTISGPIQLVQVDDPEREVLPLDGIRAAIQVERNEIWSTRINPDDFSEKDISIQNIEVEKGQRIFFRLGSVFNGSLDEVLWDPVITYQDEEISEKDASLRNRFRFQASEDFIISADQRISPPVNGRVKFYFEISKPILSDTVKFELLRLKAGMIEEIWTSELPGGEQSNIVDEIDFEVFEGEEYYLQASAHSMINWPSITSNFRFEYLESYDPEIVVRGNEGQALVEIQLAPKIIMSQRHLSRGSYVIVEEDLDSIFVSTGLVYPLNAEREETSVNVAIKKLGEVLFVTRATILNSLLVFDFDGKVQVENEDEIFAEIIIDDFMLSESIDSIRLQFQKRDKGELVAWKNLSSDVYGIYDPEAESSFTFGPLYRGWGHFGYKANREKAEQPIDINALKISEEIKSTRRINVNNLQSEEDIRANVRDPKQDDFVILVPMANEKRWSGYDQETYIYSNGMRSSRLGEKDPTMQLPIGNGTYDPGFARGIPKLVLGLNASYSVGASVGILGGSISNTIGTSLVLTDFMDLNGDRYPDVVTRRKIQYTKPNGDLSSRFVEDSDTRQISTTFMNASGASISGTFAKAVPKNSPTNIKKVEVSIGSGSNSIGLSGNAGEGDSFVGFTYMDINGDGLPDRLYANGDASLNYGYSFGKREKWGFDKIQSGSNQSFGAGLGFSLWSGSISGGIGLSRSDNYTEESFMDLNGDGLIDVVYGGRGETWARLNLGNGFSQPIQWKGIRNFGKGSSTNESAGASFTISVYIPVVGIKIGVNPSVGLSQSIQREERRIMDINGDGYPDFVVSSDESELKVKLSKIGKTNKLKEVKRPLGSVVSLDYVQVGNTYEMPNSQWVLDQVEVYDGFEYDGVNTLATKFSYHDGYYDRKERDFFGFKTIITENIDFENDKAPYARVIQKFDNSDFYKKGLLLNERMEDAEGNPFIEKANTYVLINPINGEILTEESERTDLERIFPALKSSRESIFEGQDQAVIVKESSYAYDLFGNVVSFSDRGDIRYPEDDYITQIDYHQVEEPYIVGIPSRMRVMARGQELRKRETTIDQQTGKITQIRKYLTDQDVAVFDMEYDEYGHLIKLTRPENEEGERFWIAYTYDQTVQTYVEQVSNSYGLSSSATYDYAYGQILKSTDINGVDISFELDPKGRLSKVLGPYEKARGNNGYTIRFEYRPDAEVPYARTFHYDPAHPRNDMETVTFVDGLGRVIQTKKDVAIYQGDGRADKEMMVVSGQVRYDAFGRVVASYYPVLEEKGKETAINLTLDEVNPSTQEYDVLNRVLKMTQPDGAQTINTFGFGEDREGISQLMTRSTDPNGISVEQFTDARGRVTAVKNITSEGSVWTSFEYNAINEQVAAINDLGHVTQSTYDKFGRRTKRIHPDAGETNYHYDLASNLVRLETANLMEAGEAIQYKYEQERLLEILYPQHPENNVKYTYGNTGDNHHRAGRIVLQEDGSGAQEFFYGPLGEVVKNIRTIVIPLHGEQSFTTEWTYDTWHRLESMIYPDGEEVTYTYNLGGLLRSMQGRKGGGRYDYVTQLGYDKFEQRVFLAYGNGSKTTYSYEPERRRLENMVATTSKNRVFMDNHYGYDAVNNILNLENKAPVPSANLMGGSSQYNYQYDDLYRLTEAQGAHQGKHQERYNLQMSYNSVGGITNKSQNHERNAGGNDNWKEQGKTTYEQSYTYGEDQPNAPRQIGRYAYSYDANGNTTGWQDDLSGQRRRILWDEENRLRALYDNGAMFHYIYDASGERVLKGRSSGQSIYNNAEHQGGSGSVGNYTVYVSPFMVLRSGGYTKHYFIEGQRISSKLGGGMDNPEQNTKAGGPNGVNFRRKREQMEEGIVRNLKFLGEDGQILTAGKSGKVPPGQIRGGGNKTAEEKFIYYYHPDHLGSTSYVTDASGEVYQHIEYFAFGETFVEERSNPNEIIYKFNAKELDDETGLYYYGARYYDPRISIFYGVDPLAEERSWVSPYNFVQNNPLNRIDPDGRLDWVVNGEGEIYWDDNATSQETTKKGETYLGKNVLVGTHNRDANGNEPVNTATFDLYLESNKNGPSATIKGNTVPSDISKNGTLAEGLYSAKFGRRNAEKYKDELAIRIYNLDGTDGLPTLNGNPSKANSDLLTGVLFHAGNPYQESLLDRAGNPVWSHGCQTSGCGPGSRDLHNAFMQTVGKDFKGSYYLRAKPQPAQRSFNLQMPTFTVPADNTYVAPRVILNR